jgi:hypothetical protein
MSKRDRRAYFKTFALENGPALLGIPTKKPHPKTLQSRGVKVDEDGVWYSIIEDHESLGVYKLEAKHLVYATIAADINVKRALRRQVVPMLDAVARDVAALKDQLDRIERKLGAGVKGQETNDMRVHDGKAETP